MAATISEMAPAAAERDDRATDTAAQRDDRATGTASERLNASYPQAKRAQRVQPGGEEVTKETDSVPRRGTMRKARNNKNI